MVRLRQRTGSYWEKRSIERLTAAEAASNKHLMQIYSVYDDARRKTVDNIKSLYRNYYKGDDGFDMIKLRSIAPTGDVRRFLRDMKQAGLSTYLPDEYQGRMTRLELLNAQMWGETHKIALRQTPIQTAAHLETIQNAYYHSIFDMAKGLGATPAFTQLNTKTVNQILNAKFDGKNYSERIWANTGTLAAQLKSKLGATIASGQSQAKTTREIQERFQVGKYYATRLVRTETNYFENKAEIESYESMGIEKFVFVATLDSRTSLICAEHDGNIFDVSKAVAGDNYPPLHPNCRSTIRPYIGKDFEPETRIARDTNGRNVYVSNMPYDEWQKQFTQDFAGMIGDSNVLSVGANAVKTAYGAVFDTDSLWGVNSDLLKTDIARAEKLLDQYEPVQKWVKDEGGLVVRGGYPKAMASTLRKKPIITLNRSYHATKETLVKQVFNGIKRGHFMPASDYTGYTFNHEFGHVVENYLMGKKIDSTSLANKMMDDIISIAMRKQNMTYDQVLTHVSKYGKTNSREFFAEAFANLHGGRPTIIGRAMQDYLKGAIK